MNLEKMTKEELETLSYADLAEMIIKKDKKSLNTPTIFKEICKLLQLTDEEYQSQIGDFYTSLTTDKRFILLDNACWDLRDKHAIDIVMDDDDLDAEESDEEEILDSEENSEDENSEDIDSVNNDDSIDDDDLEDLTIIDEEEIEE